MSSLGEDFPKEQARVRELIQVYSELCPITGKFAVFMFEELLRRADVAVMEQDLPKMIQIYQEMKECK